MDEEVKIPDIPPGWLEAFTASHPAFAVVMALSTGSSQYATNPVALIQRADPDWNAVIRQAVYHRMHGMLARNLEELGWPGVPSETRTLLEQLPRRMRARNLFLLQELARVLAYLEGHGVPALSFKGPVLSSLAYGSLDARQCADLDILIPATDIEAVDVLLRQDDYTRLNPDPSPARRRIRYFFEREHHYVRGNNVYNLDIHAAPITPRFSYQVSFDTLRARAVTVDIRGTDFPTCGIEDLIVLLCYHGAKDRWARLSRIADLYGVMQGQDRWDASSLVERVGRMRGERILALGFSLVAIVHRYRMPEPVEKLMTRHPDMQVLATKLTNRLPYRIDGNPWGSLVERSWYPVTIQDTYSNALRYASFAFLSKALNLYDRAFTHNQQ